MSEFFDWNEARGNWYEYDYDHQSDKVVIHTKQDVEPILELAKERRNNGKGDAGVKGEFWHYAFIPAWFEVELKNRGINLYDKNDLKKVLKVINQEFPYLKTTNLNHAIK
jgi:hypothetical protein